MILATSVNVLFRGEVLVIAALMLSVGVWIGWTARKVSEWLRVKKETEL